MVTSGRPRPDKLPLSMRFHDKPYDPIAVLRQAKEMTIPLGWSSIDWPVFFLRSNQQPMAASGQKRKILQWDYVVRLTLKSGH
jgi:hypothetical protein